METSGATLRGKRILICEDEGMIQLHWKKLLDRHGASVVSYTDSGDECIDLALKDRPDIVLMDVGLNHMDGWEASKRILSMWDTCIVVVTGETPNAVEDKLRNIPVSGYIQKPTSGAEFIQALNRCYTESKYSTNEEHSPTA
jgi:NarL family two-component system response regulator LiaR